MNIQFAFTPEAFQPTGRITALDPGVARRLTGSDGFSSMPVKRDRVSAATLQRSMSTFRERALTDGRARWEPVMTQWGTPSFTKRGKPRFRLEWIAGNESLKLRRMKDRLSTLRHRDKVRARNLTHEVTSELVQNYDVIGIEDTALANMTRSAAGTAGRAREERGAEIRTEQKHTGAESRTGQAAARLQGRMGRQTAGAGVTRGIPQGHALGAAVLTTGPEPIEYIAATSVVW